MANSIKSSPVSLLFICLGNICRSPLAEGIFRDVVGKAGKADHYKIDSAALGSWHIGNPPDSRAIDVAARHGVNLNGQRCRQITAADFDTFDFIIGMDHENMAALEAQKPAGAKARIEMMLEFAQARDAIVPDPYYGDDAGFETAYQLLEKASKDLLVRLEAESSNAG